MNFLYIKESQKIFGFHKKKKKKLLSALIKRNVAPNQHIIMISEGSCDTEDWSDDAENSALPSQKKITFKIEKLYFKY